MRENNEARAKCMKNRLHLGQFVTQRSATSEREVTKKSPILCGVASLDHLLQPLSHYYTYIQ